MTDITKFILKYRNSVRELWNNYFVERQNDSDSFALEVDIYFENIKQELFKALVSTKAFDEEITYSTDLPLTKIEVQPNLGPKGYAAMFNKSVEGNNTIWDEIWIKTKNNKFHYIDFFDWTVELVMDCQYIRVRLSESTEFPDLIGKDFLFDAWNAQYRKTNANNV